MARKPKGHQKLEGLIENSMSQLNPFEPKCPLGKAEKAPMGEEESLEIMSLV